MSKNTAMKYGYARVSTNDQKANLQIAALKKAGYRHIFTDTATGASSKRPELTRCLESLRTGNTLIVWKLDPSGGAVIVALGGGAVRFTREGDRLPVADRRHRHRKRSGTAVRSHAGGLGRV